MRRILHIIILACLIGLVFVLFAFAAKEHALKPYTELYINNTSKNPDGILAPDEVKFFLHKHFKDFVGQPISTVSIDTIERILRKNPYVSDVEAYTDINGKLFIDYTEEQAVLRLFNQSGQSAFLSSDGRLLPLKPGFSARVPVVNGNLGPLPPPGASVTQETYPIIHDLLALSQVLLSDDFYWNLVDQIYVDGRGEITLIPRIGHHIIQLGKTDDVGEKMENLKLFYQKGLTQGSWNRYSSISLKYKNQVVCTKK